MIVALELDGMICSPIYSMVSIQAAEQCTAIEGAKDALLKLKELGHTILIYSHRDLSLGQASEVWLQKNKIPYDRIILGKPQYDLMLDAKSQRFESWTKFLETNHNMIHSLR